MSTFPGEFVPVLPPADGLRLAFVAARRRRNRKAGAAGAAGLLAAVAFLASAGGTGDRALLQEPVPPASTSGHGVLPGTDAPAPQSQRPTPATAVVPSDARPGGAAGGQLPAALPAAADRSSTGRGGGRFAATANRPVSGPMQRGTGFLYTGGDLVCPARKQQEHQRGLCTDVYVTSNSNGTMTLVAEICNVGTATEVLSFRSARELDLTVRQGELDVWRWSLGRRFAPTPHEIAVGTQDCVVWSTAWSRVDARGVPVKAGSYTVVADLDADEVAGPDRHPSYPITISSQP